MARPSDLIEAPFYRQFLPLTLVVQFTDGNIIKVPYFDYDCASNYLESLDDLDTFWVTPYTGE